MPVHVEGKLQTNKWEGNDGVKRSRLEIVALRVQFLIIIRQESVEDVKVVNASGNINEFSGQLNNVSDDDIQY